MIKPAIEGGKPVREKGIEAFPKFTEEEMNEILEVLRSGRLTMSVGTKIREFEEAFAKFNKVKNAVAVSNGTAALHTALKAAGIGPGDEVITTPFTFVATASTILHQNAIPIFADIDRETFNIDPESIRERINERTKAVIAVHLCGHPAEMDEIRKLCDEKNLILIEDCAQAIGAKYRGRNVGTIGEINAFSFYISKNITTGEGGMITTDDDELAEKARLIRNHGESSKYHYTTLGYNYRMTELQAAIGLIQLRRIEELNERRREIAEIYNDMFEDVELITTPTAKPYVKHVWHIYNILIDVEKLRKPRDRIVEAIKKENVWVTVAYPNVLYLEPLFKHGLGHGKGCPWNCPFYKGRVEYRRGLCPNAEWISRRVITLPTHPSLRDDDAIDIATAVKKIVNYYRK